MIKTQLNIFKSFIDVLFPNRCVFCGKPLKNESYICNQCKVRLDYIGDKTCKRCGAPINKDTNLMIEKINDSYINGCSNCEGFDFSFYKNESLYVYSGIIRNLIHLYKFKKRWRLYKYFSKELINYKNEYIKDFDFIIAVPLTKSRLKERGYNQSSLIAEEISRVTGVCYLKNALNRRGHSKPQSITSNIDERYINMEDKIEVNSKYINMIEDKNILLFDDILTTGITASVCSDALYSVKVRNVSLLTIARTLR